ncbi:MAG: type IV conjugative transfer system protein TraE [Thermomicrobiales bacterium]|nr:MAG: type IV conjugative transfer system protein TraE [Thermomicrobiales bacterium]
MDLETQQNAIRELRARNRNQAFVITLLAVSLFVSVIGTLSVMGSERTVVVPPNLSKSFWVDGKRASADYLEQMGGFVSWLILDVSPQSIDWKKDILLDYVSPEQFGALQSRQNLESDRLKKLNASTYFATQQLSVREQSQEVEIRGRLKTQVNGLETTNEPKAYAAQFAYAGGRIHLESFKEIPYDNKPVQAAARDGGSPAN